jgi:hypothetical protein
MLLLFRQLCLDALVEEGDVNMDWRLGYEEYREIMKEEYLPSTQGLWDTRSTGRS